MSLGEFDLIAQYFNTQKQLPENGVVIDIGDDCAILDIPEGYQLAVSTDTLVSGVHFFADVDPYRLGYKALAVNLSDLAAMGATPKWASLAITLPDINEKWVAAFSRGFFDLAKQFNVSLVGGDTTKGPLAITVSVKGLIPRGLALLRSQAQVHDLVCVSGYLGDGGLGLQCKLQHVTPANNTYFIDALELTQPRIDLGIQLRGLASSCMDISDGLTQDLIHILKASQCVADIDVDKLPLSAGMLEEIELANITQKQALQLALTGGDDYELLFTIGSDQLAQLRRLTKDKITVIGKITHRAHDRATDPLIQLFYNQQSVSFSQQGWDHFHQGNI